VGYFRDAGYDCQLLNIAVEGGEATVERLGEGEWACHAPRRSDIC
jgi:hypothetical protein